MMPDVLIVGSGIIGLSCAVALQDAGLTVMVLDASAEPGNGASGARSVLLTPPTGRLADKPLGQLCHQSFTHYATWCTQLASSTGIDPRFTQCGSLRLYQQQPRRVREHDTWYDTTALRHIEPAVTAANESFAGAVFSPLAAHVHPQRLLHALHARFQARGGMHHVETAVQLCKNGNAVTGVRLWSGQVISAGHVLLSAGVGTIHLLDTIGIHLSIVGDGGLMLQLTNVPQPHHLLLWGEYGIIGKPDGSVWVNGVHLPEAHRDSYETTHATAALARAALAVLGNYGNIQSIWEGIRPRAPQGIPYIGPIAGLHRFSLAVGHGSNGFLLAPFTAQIIQSTIAAGIYPDDATMCHPDIRLATTPQTVAI